MISDDEAYSLKNDDMKQLEEEEIEFEDAPDAEVVRSKTKSGKVDSNIVGDLKKMATKEDNQNKQYRFVKRLKPTEIKRKITSPKK